MNNTLADSFKQYFAVNFVHEKRLKEQIYKIRYRVYCEEFGYEPRDNFPDKQEYDEFDSYALHCLITHKASGYPAGCVRLVPGIRDNQPTFLPLEKYCNQSLDQEVFSRLSRQRNNLCEISRLAVDGLFRRRSDEHRAPFGNTAGLMFNANEQRLFPMIAVSAFLATTALTVLTGKTNALAMMEPFLPRLLKRSGIFFEQVGEPIDYHGVRAPYLVTTESALATMKPELKALYQVIHDSIRTEYEAYLAIDQPPQPAETIPVR